MEAQLDPLEGLVFGLDKIDEQWGELINQINEGNVIPVIGPDLLTETTNGENYHQMLINKLAKWAEVSSKPKTFSQLVYDGGFLSALKNKINAKEDGIYLLLNRLAVQMAEQNVKIKPHPVLLRLMETKRFPFVITTSFMPVVEDCMRQVWGDVKVLQFNNDPNRSMEIGKGDIKSDKELNRPTVFYMFGKVCKEPHRYAVTDMDLMEFCKSWLTGTGVPRNIAESLKKRYLLFMGGSYNDWLFRFIWFSMRHKQKDNNSLFVVRSKVTANECKECRHEQKILQSLKEEDSFEKFLERIDAFTQHDPEFVIGKIEERLAKLDEENRRAEDDGKGYKWDVFISYSRTDKEIAKHLYGQLDKKGLRVWFDTEAIGPAEKWKERIGDGIRRTKLFVPLLTQNIEKECMDSHEYRIEWEEAAERAKRIGGIPFIIPVSESTFDFYSPRTSVPNQFRELNSTKFDSIEDMPRIAEVIIQKLEQLDELTNTIKYGK